jgi:hypothetical protein
MKHFEIPKVITKAERQKHKIEKMRKLYVQHLRPPVKHPVTNYAIEHWPQDSSIISSIYDHRSYHTPASARKLSSRSSSRASSRSKSDSVQLPYINMKEKDIESQTSNQTNDANLEQILAKNNLAANCKEHNRIIKMAKPQEENKNAIDRYNSIISNPSSLKCYAKYTYSWKYGVECYTKPKEAEQQLIVDVSTQNPVLAAIPQLSVKTPPKAWTPLSSSRPVSRYNTYLMFHTLYLTNNF